MSPPLVSIGMPVYNGERTVRAAIESILQQTWRDWELVISDNASTDATAQICRDFAEREPRIRYLRQPANLGAPANFRKVLDESRGKYFMWAAADDCRSADFLEVNVGFLETHPDYVASCSPVRLDSAEHEPRYSGDEPVLGTRSERILQVIPAHANGRFYSVFRRSALEGCDLVERTFLGADWAIMVHVAEQGPLHRAAQGWTLLGAGGASRSGNLYRNARRTWLDMLLPFNALSAYVWSRRRGLAAREKLKLALKLAHLNAFGFVAQSREALARHSRP